MTATQETEEATGYRDTRMNERKFIRVLEQHLYGCLLIAKRMHAKRDRRKAFYKTEVDAFRRDLLMRRDVDIEHKVDEDLFICYLERSIRWIKRAVELGVVKEEDFISLLDLHKITQQVRDFREHAERYASIEGNFWDGPGRFVNKYWETNPKFRSDGTIIIGEAWTYINGDKYFIGGMLDFSICVQALRQSHKQILKRTEKPVDSPIRHDQIVALFHDPASEMSNSVLSTLREFDVAFRLIENLGVPVFLDLLSELNAAELEVSDYVNVAAAQKILGRENLNLAFDGEAHDTLQGNSISVFLQPPILFGNFGFRKISSQTDLQSFVDEMRFEEFAEGEK